ncbi:MAG: alanyl-tRNA editing protein, partial [Bellilinea sp.]
MTELLYQIDSYLQEFDAQVTAVDAEHSAVLLDRTAFYPGGGGQPADSGTLTVGAAVYPVARAKKGSQGVWHLLDGNQPLPAVGATVHGKIDWEPRYQLMRT